MVARDSLSYTVAADKTYVPENQRDQSETRERWNLRNLRNKGEVIRGWSENLRNQRETGEK